MNSNVQFYVSNLLHVDHSAAADGCWRSHPQVLNLKHHVQDTRELDALRVRQTKGFVVVQYLMFWICEGCVAYVRISLWPSKSHFHHVSIDSEAGGYHERSHKVIYHLMSDGRSIETFTLPLRNRASDV